MSNNRKSKDKKGRSGRSSMFPGDNYAERFGSSVTEGMHIRVITKNAFTVAPAINTIVQTQINPATAFWGQRCVRFATMFSQFKCRNIKIILYPPPSASSAALPQTNAIAMSGVVDDVDVTLPVNLQDLSQFQNFALLTQNLTEPVVFEMKNDVLSKGIQSRYKVVDSLATYPDTIQGSLFYAFFGTATLTNYFVVEAEWDFWNPVGISVALGNKLTPSLSVADNLSYSKPTFGQFVVESDGCAGGQTPAEDAKHLHCVLDGQKYSLVKTG